MGRTVTPDVVLKCKGKNLFTNSARGGGKGIWTYGYIQLCKQQMFPLVNGIPSSGECTQTMYIRESPTHTTPTVRDSSIDTLTTHLHIPIEQTPSPLPQQIKSLTSCIQNKNHATLTPDTQARIGYVRSVVLVLRVTIRLATRRHSTRRCAYVNRK